MTSGARPLAVAASRSVITAIVCSIVAAVGNLANPAWAWLVAGALTLVIGCLAKYEPGPRALIAASTASMTFAVPGAGVAAAVTVAPTRLWVWLAAVAFTVIMFVVSLCVDNGVLWLPFETVASAMFTTAVAITATLAPVPSWAWLTAAILTIIVIAVMGRLAMQVSNSWDFFTINMVATAALTSAVALTAVFASRWWVWGVAGGLTLLVHVAVDEAATEQRIGELRDRLGIPHAPHWD